MVSAVVSRQAHGGEVEDYALATMRTPSGILVHNEVGYTMPTWPANQTDGEQKVAGERLLACRSSDPVATRPSRSRRTGRPATRAWSATRSRLGAAATPRRSRRANARTPSA